MQKISEKKEEIIGKIGKFLLVLEEDLSTLSFFHIACGHASKQTKKIFLCGGGEEWENERWKGEKEEEEKREKRIFSSPDHFFPPLSLIVCCSPLLPLWRRRGGRKEEKEEKEETCH